MTQIKSIVGLIGQNYGTSGSALTGRGKKVDEIDDEWDKGAIILCIIEYLLIAGIVYIALSL